MSLRIRADGTILCAAKHPEQPGDTYLDDAVHYALTAQLGILVTEPMHLDGGRGGHEQHGEWWPRDAVPVDVIPDMWANSRSSDEHPHSERRHHHR